MTKASGLGRILISWLRLIVSGWGTTQRPELCGFLWMATLLGVLVVLDGTHEDIFLVPPFAATLTILLYLSNARIAQPFAIVVGSTAGAALGTTLAALLGGGPAVAAGSALAALMLLPLIRAYHPPGVALAMYPALLHPGPFFAVAIVLPFTLCAVASLSLLSRKLPARARYPAPLSLDGR